MDIFGIINLPDILLIFVIVVVGFYMYGRKNFGYFAKINIKGPPPTAFVGNMSYLKKHGFHKSFSIWRKTYGDCFGYFIGPTPILIVSDPEMIGEITVKRFSNFTNRQGVLQQNELRASMLMSATDDHWKFLRAVISPFYSLKHMREITPLIEKAVTTLVKKVENSADTDEECNVNNLFSCYTMDVIASTGFGIEVDSQENPDSPLVKKAKKVFETGFFATIQKFSIIFPILGKILKLFDSKILMGNFIDIVEFCQEIIAERKENPKQNARKDLLQLMLDAQLEGHEKLDKKTEEELKLENVTDWRTKRGLKDIEIIAQCVLLFLAGFETTASTLSYFAHCMAINPEVQEKLYEQIESVLGQDAPNYDNVQKVTLLEKCMDETLRKYSIATMIVRKCKNDCTIKGVRIPAGAMVHMPIQCLHDDPRFWPNPETFDPERFNQENKSKQIPYSYLPFGAGPRMCSGIRLAQLEFKMVIVEILRHFRFVPCEKTENPIQFALAPLLRPKNGIWLKFVRR